MLSEPFWVTTDLKAESELQIYFQRIKIESFHDLKNLLHLNKLINKKTEQMEKMIALEMLAFSIGVLTGEDVRDAVFGEFSKGKIRVSTAERIPGHPNCARAKNENCIPDCSFR